MLTVHCSQIIMQNIWMQNLQSFLTGEMNGIQKNPLQDFRFINSGDSFFDNARWSINSLEIDLENEKTIKALRKLSIEKEGWYKDEEGKVYKMWIEKVI